MAEGRFGAALEDEATWAAEEEVAGGHNAVVTDPDTDFGGREAVGATAVDDGQTQSNTFGLTDEQLAALGEGAQLPDNLAAQSQAAWQQANGQTANGQAQQQATSPLRDYLVQNHGLHALADAPNDTEAVGRLVDVLGTLQQQNQQLAQQMQFMQLQVQQARQMPGGGPGPVQQAHEVQTKTKWQGPPEWNPGWAQMVERAPDGRLVAKAGAMPDIPDKIQAYQNYIDQQSAALWKNPVEFVMDAGLGDQIQPMIQQAIQAEVGNLQARMFGEQLRVQHGDWMFAKDHTGRPMADPVRGGPVLTSEGQQVTQHLANFVSRGFPMEQAWQMAMQLVTGEGTLAYNAWQRAQGAAGQQHAPVNSNDPAQRQAAQQQQNAAFLQRQNAAARKPNQTGRTRTQRAAPAAEQIPLRGSALMEALFQRNLQAVANGTAA